MCDVTSDCDDEWRQGYIAKCVPKTQYQLIDWDKRNGTTLNEWCLNNKIRNGPFYEAD